MSIQPINNASTNSYVSPLTNDLQNLQNDIQAYQTAQSSGNQDQVSISQAAMKQVLIQLQGDIAGSPQGTQGAAGHHHHHHHKMNGANGSGNTATNNPFASIATTAAYGNSTQSQNSVSSVNLTA